MAQEYRPCPICKGVNADQCECCKGIGRFPYPWILQSDKLIRRRWTAEESGVIYDAVSGVDASRRYFQVYGSYERTYSSVYRHWQTLHPERTINHGWTDREIESIQNSVTAHEAITDYRAIHGTMRTANGIRTKYYRLHFQKN